MSGWLERTKGLLQRRTVIVFSLAALSLIGVGAARRLLLGRKTESAPASADRAVDPSLVDRWGYASSQISVAPPQSTLSLERQRDRLRIARVVVERRGVTSSVEPTFASRAEAAIPKTPLVAYVGVAAVVNLAFGFLCAMHIGYRPKVFGVRLGLRRSDPFAGLDEAMSEETST